MTIHTPHTAADLDALNLDLREYMRVHNTPKRYAVMARGKLYFTNDLERCLLDRVTFDFRDLKATEITVIDRINL